MRVMGVVCALWSCGAEKCPFDFGRTCVRLRAEERTKERTWVWRERRAARRVSSPPEDAEPCHRPRRMRGVRAQDLVVLAGPSGPSLQVRSLSCAMSGERVGGSSRETRGAIEARGDGASDGVLGL